MRNPACSLGNTPSRHSPLSHAVREHARGRHGAAASSKGDATKMRGGAGGVRASECRHLFRMSALPPRADIGRLAAYSLSQMPSPQSRVIQRDHPQQKACPDSLLAGCLVNHCSQAIDVPDQ